MRLFLLTALFAVWLGGPGLASEQPEAEFQLVDSQGQPVTEQSFRGRFLMVTFGYTYCPDVCPTTLNTVAGVMDELGPIADRLQPIFITVDPERDGPAKMGAYAKHFHPRIIGLTGTSTQVAAAADAFGATYKKVARPGGDYLMDHSAYIDLFDRQGKYVYSFAYDDALEKITAITRKHMTN